MLGAAAQGATCCCTPSRSSTAPIRARRCAALRAGRVGRRADAVPARALRLRRRAAADRAVHRDLRHLRQRRRPRAELPRRREAARRDAPGWKVLRVLGNLLGLPGFDFDSVGARCATTCSAARRRCAARLAQRHRAAAHRWRRRTPRQASSASPTCRSISPIRSCAARRRCSRPPTRSRRGAACTRDAARPSSASRDGDAGARRARRRRGGAAGALDDARAGRVRARRRRRIRRPRELGRDVRRR